MTTDTTPSANAISDNMRRFVAVGSGYSAIERDEMTGRLMIDASSVIPGYDAGPAPDDAYATVVSINASVSRTLYSPHFGGRIFTLDRTGNGAAQVYSRRLAHSSEEEGGTAAYAGISVTAYPQAYQTPDLRNKVVVSVTPGAEHAPPAGYDLSALEIDGARYSLTALAGYPNQYQANGVQFGEDGLLKPKPRFPASTPHYVFNVVWGNGSRIAMLYDQRRTWAEVHDRVSIQWLREGALNKALNFTSWVYSPQAAQLGLDLGLVVLGVTPLRDLSDLFSEQWEERASVDVGFGYTVDTNGLPEEFFAPIPQLSFAPSSTELSTSLEDGVFTFEFTAGAD